MLLWHAVSSLLVTIYLKTFKGKLIEYTCIFLYKYTYIYRLPYIGRLGLYFSRYQQNFKNVLLYFVLRYTNSIIHMNSIILYIITIQIYIIMITLFHKYVKYYFIVYNYTSINYNWYL